MAAVDVNSPAAPQRPGGRDRPRPPGRRARPARLSRLSRLSRLDRVGSPYLYIAPFFVLFAIFGLYPLGYTAWLALTDQSPLNPQTSFVGLDNFATLAGDPKFWTAVRNTLGMFVLATVPQLLLALALANWLNRALRGIGFFRIAVAIPIVTSTAVVALVFGMFFARDYGLVNWVLEGVGIGGVDWRAEKYAAWAAIASMVDWRWTGYNALIYLAAMQAVPRSLYEVAEIDGASRTRQFWQITVPLLQPTIIFTVIISTIGGMQLFVEPLMFTSGSGALSGGTLGQFQTVTMYLVQTMRAYHQWGYAAAIALLLFGLIMLVSAVNFLLVRRIRGER